ncbi:hypothetical protein EDC65_2720 [Stella humosa]|uniref:Uncharacterized protein n=2 Tax=Stella humosa TaxID=94 RepID=A0A3N1LHX0_9PROT|nr:hypothetical protein [Stella humosa]ROP90860.1 hypothetical protein EDC65_2720 [Stella humosa]BBK34791.1 hypothetical protein STHU_54250 [Stella humosa]
MAGTARPHRLALAIAAAIVVAWAAGAGLLLALGTLPPDRSGTVAVLFPPGTGGMAALAAVAAADGVLVRDTILPNVVIADGREPGFVGRLRQAGALAAYPPLDIGFAMIGGCTGLPPPR